MNTQEMIDEIKKLEKTCRDEKSDYDRGYIDACTDIKGILWELEDSTIAVEINNEMLSSYFIGRVINAFEKFKYMIKHAK